MPPKLRFDLDASSPSASPQGTEAAAAAASASPGLSPTRRAELSQLVLIMSFLVSGPMMFANVLALYTASSSAEAVDFYSDVLFYAAYHIVIVAAMVIIGTRLPGEFMMAAFFMLGFAQEYFGIGVYSRNAEAVAIFANFGPVFWTALEALTGAFCGVFCRSKDLLESRSYTFRKSYAHRLNMHAVYMIGVWVAVIARSGWHGLFVVYSSIFILLSVVGWGLFALRVIRSYMTQSNESGRAPDLLSIMASLANASFGKVMVLGGLALAVVAYLLVPIVQTLTQHLPHTMLGALAILVEFTVYDFLGVGAS